MEVFLIRHGIAESRGTYQNDEQRPLTSKGITKTTQVADSLVKRGLKLDLILTSPLVRAAQTAEILQQAGLSNKITTHTFLKPDGAVAEWLEYLEQNWTNSSEAKIALVGHQPDLGNWVEMLLWGTIKNQLVLKKAGVIGLKMPSIGTPIARSTLFLHTAPKWLI
ncbi:MAG: phosphohistidine phosphatase SixA [Cyanobacteria bacterium J06600_6]